MKDKIAQIEPGLPRRTLEDAESELGEDGEQMVEDVRLDRLVVRPANVLGEDVDLDGEPLR